jgi:DNA polymerase-3 subunit epsilon/ATP-dependent DNA helicase DinG
MLAERLHAERATAVATSATLAAAGDMRYSAGRIGMPEADSLQLGSPFDYRSATLLAALDDLPAPDQRSYGRASGEAIAELAIASGGRALALFTSHAALREAAEYARPLLDREGIATLVQGAQGNPRQLTDALKLDPRSVIFGTASFWEGVDIRGEALSLLVIARLPFAVPTDPIYRARSEQFDNPFGDYALPSAILRFRQGFGRLIRDRNDRGVVAILDRRIFEKSYGRQFAGALPDCTRVKGPAELVAQRTREWLAR